MECYNYVNEGLKIRSRASWYESGERDSRYFNQLLCTNKKKSCIKKLKNADDSICSEDKEIVKKYKGVL